MNRFMVALIAKNEGEVFEVFPFVESLNLYGMFIFNAQVRLGDAEDLPSWKRRILHYAASENWFSVHFVECVEQCYNRSMLADSEGMPGDANFAIFPVRSEERATEKESTDEAAGSEHSTCSGCGKPIEVIHGIRHYIYGKEYCGACVHLNDQPTSEGSIAAPTGSPPAEEEATCLKCGNSLDGSLYAIKGEPVCRDCAPDGV